MLSCRCLRGFYFASSSEYLRFWIYLCSEYARVLHMPLALNMLGFWIYQGSEYAGITQGSKSAWIFSRHAFYIIYLGTKMISKNVKLPPQKSLWTSLKLPQKFENCFAIVKKLTCGRFFSLLFLYKVFIRKCSRTSVTLQKRSCTFWNVLFQKILKDGTTKGMSYLYTVTVKMTFLRFLLSFPMKMLIMKDLFEQGFIKLYISSRR